MDGPAVWRPPQAWSYPPVGVTLPPYQLSVARPYYLYHWSMAGHELGVEVGPWDEVGLARASPGSPPRLLRSPPVSLGGASDVGGAYYGETDGTRFGVFAVGPSVGLDGVAGVRGTVLNFHIGPVQTSLAELMSPHPATPST